MGKEEETFKQIGLTLAKHQDHVRGQKAYAVLS